MVEALSRRNEARCRLMPEVGGQQVLPSWPQCAATPGAREAAAVEWMDADVGIVEVEAVHEDAFMSIASQLSAG